MTVVVITVSTESSIRMKQCPTKDNIRNSWGNKPEWNKSCPSTNHKSSVLVSPTLGVHANLKVERARHDGAVMLTFQDPPFVVHHQV